MRRWLITLLLVLIPLQVSWAMAANYCEHEQEKGSQHFGHHPEEHAASLDDHHGDDQPPGNESSLGHCHDHLSGFVALLLTDPAVSIHFALALRLQDIEPSLATSPSSQPERPNWSSPA